MKKSVAFALFAVLSLAVFAGCQKRPEGLPTLYPTTITITTMDGKPITEAYVSVSDPAKPISFTIAGKTDANGVAEMQVQLSAEAGTFKGAPEGKLTVAVTKNIRVVPDGNENESFGAQIIDEEFTDTVRSPLSIEVKPTGKNEATFQCGINPDYADKI